MIDTYIGSKGEKTLIKDMEVPHLIHSIAKLAKALGVTEAQGEARVEGEEMLKALKAEAIARLTPKKEEIGE